MQVLNVWTHVHVGQQFFFTELGIRIAYNHICRSVFTFRNQTAMTKVVINRHVRSYIMIQTV